MRWVGAGDEACGLRQRWIMLHDGRVFGERGQRDGGADLDCVFVGMNRLQPLDPVHVDQHRRRYDAAPDIDHQIGAAAERLAVGMFRARRDRLVERGRI